MNIAVIFTGGTIGSSIQQNYVSTDSQMPYRLLEMYNESQAKDNPDFPHFITVEPYTTLSEYMNGLHLNLLIASVREQLAQEIDGIIITHGTDTLPFTAAALGMCFAYARIPILLVSSNYILDDPRANGLTNFTAAVDYIYDWKHTHSGHGTSNEATASPDTAAAMYAPDFPILPTAVGIAYCNTGDAPKIYNALGIYNHRPFDDSLYERPYDAYAEAIAPVLRECSVIRHVTPDSICTSGTTIDLLSGNTDIPDPGRDLIQESYTIFDTTCPVCFFQSMPGMQYHLPDDARAVLIHAYHSGTINTKNPSLLALTGRAAQKKIPVYLTGISTESTDYDSKAVYESLGIIPLPEYSPLVAYMYLWYKYSRRD